MDFHKAVFACTCGPFNRPLQSRKEMISRNQQGFQPVSFVTVLAPTAQPLTRAQTCCFYNNPESTRQCEKQKKKYWSRISGKKTHPQPCTLVKWSLLEQQVLTRCFSDPLIYLLNFWKVAHTMSPNLGKKIILFNNSGISKKYI